MAAPRFVLVSGPPGSGKSTVAGPLASELRLALIAKDTIKEALMAELAVPDVSASGTVGRIAIRTMFAVAADSPIGAVIDCNLHRSRSLAGIGTLPGQIVEVFCRCDRDTAERRYRARASQRHAGHFDSARAFDHIWHEHVTNPVSGGWPVIDLDTTLPVDIPAVAEAIRRSLV